MQPLPEIESPKKFVRDSLTWLGYLLGASFSFCSSSLGPLMPFLRADLHLSYTQGAYHFSAWALGSLCSGIWGDRLMRIFGRHKTLWGGAIGGCIGVLLIGTMSQVYLTIFGALTGGFAGSVLGQTVTTIMADRFGEERAVGITEANISASLASFIAPLLVGLCVKMGMPWRLALCFPVATFFIVFLAFRGKPIPIPAQTEIEKSGGSLSRTYWIFWTIVTLSVACEWSIIFWSSDFLEHSVKLSKADAAESVSAFLVAMLIGRIIGSRASLKYSIHTLLGIAAFLAVSGFLAFWLGSNPVVNLFGLFSCGLGIANFYPLTISAAIGAADEKTTTATARLSLGTGLATLVAPFVLGTIADKSDIFVAYGVVALLLTLCSIMVFVANLHSRRRAQ